MTTILLECPECGADAEGRVFDAETAESGSETVFYSCTEGCEGVLVAPLS
jgi:hypothetical protein